MPGKTLLMKRSAVLAPIVLGVLLGAASAQTETALYSFCAKAKCADGFGPPAGLTFDQKGNLYGTTGAGGAGKDCPPSYTGCGVVFKLTPEGKETVLYSFCAQSRCADGANPYAGLAIDQKGNMYGTTYSGGAHNDAGVLFKLTPEGKETVLYSFCARGGEFCTDGAKPDAGLVLDQKGNLYGTAVEGGAYEGGVVFKVTPEGKETVLYSFCAQFSCADGAAPLAGLIFDRKGNLYGTTFEGGDGSGQPGVVFKLTPGGKETVLYSFCTQENCADGAVPLAGLIFDQKGNLYGTTFGGGVPINNCTYQQKGCGVVFKLTPKGKETVLYTFCAQTTDCADGAGPRAGLVFDQKGDLYGTTIYGGAYASGYYGGGVVFKLTPRGKETVLHAFCEHENCSDGAGPGAGLIFDQKGNLYGTTGGGGAHNGGVVFKLTP